MKTCRHCGTAKDVAEFPTMAACKDGLSSWCRACHREGARESYQARRAAVLARDKAERDAARPARLAATAARRAAKEAARHVGRSCQVRYGSCVECESPFVRVFRSGDSQKFCSSRCSWTANNRRNTYRRSKPLAPVGARTCEECGSSFIGTPGRRFDTAECGRRFHATHARHRSRSAIKESAERISRLVVFERDGWLCGICGQYVDRQTPTNDMLGPTLDHVIPLARGGVHTYANVQLAHRLCNIAKGARVAA